MKPTSDKKDYVIESEKNKKNYVIESEKNKKINDITEKTVGQLEDLNIEVEADSIVNDPENIKNVLEFPESLKHLNSKQMFDFTSYLSGEITDNIETLRELGIERKEYSTEITDEDSKQIEDLYFVIEHKDELGQEKWGKFKKEADVVLNNMEEEIREKGIEIE